MQNATLNVSTQLCLERLQSQHFDTLSLLCDDNVCYQVQLPSLKTRYAWQVWLEDQNQQGHSHYAIRDTNLGVIGAAGFEQCQSCNLFYFWLGRSVRCQGIGTTIATYLYKTLSPSKTTYALTFANNMASSRAFQKSRWYLIHVPVMLCDMSVRVFSHKHVPRHTARAELAKCFAELKSDLVLNSSLKST